MVKNCIFSMWKYCFSKVVKVWFLYPLQKLSYFFCNKEVSPYLTVFMVSASLYFPAKVILWTIQQSQWEWNQCNLTFCIPLFVALIQCCFFSFHLATCSLYTFLPISPPSSSTDDLFKSPCAVLSPLSKTGRINNHSHSNPSIELILIII